MTTQWTDSLERIDSRTYGIRPGQLRELGLVVIGEWGYGSAGTFGEIVCPAKDRAAVQAAYDAIDEDASAPHKLDDVHAAGGVFVVEVGEHE